MGIRRHMYNEAFKKAMKIKGYGSFPNTIKNGDIEKVKNFRDGSNVKITVVESITDYMNFINTLNTNFTNPVFYRGQINANYLIQPYSFRKNISNEHILIENFKRYFYSELANCKTSVEKLILMQHYGLATRCLDISENPLVALYFACVPYKKFRDCSKISTDDDWGEVILFREKSTEAEKSNNTKPERLKEVNSSNVSIIANTAFMEKEFSLWDLGACWKVDRNQTYTEVYINLKSIVRSSFIVRVPFDNPRIKNQRGAFILVNSNKAYIVKNEHSYFENELTKFINYNEYTTYDDLLVTDKYKKYLDKQNTWELKFHKVKPYDDSNEFDFFKTDPFNLKRIFYKDNENNNLVVLIPPKAKEKIKQELSRFGITDMFIYPDMDTVANEINVTIE